MMTIKLGTCSRPQSKDKRRREYQRLYCELGGEEQHGGCYSITGYTPSNSTALIPAGYMERPRGRWVSHHQLLLVRWTTPFLARWQGTPFLFLATGSVSWLSGSLKLLSFLFLCSSLSDYLVANWLYSWNERSPS